MLNVEEGVDCTFNVMADDAEEAKLEGNAHLASGEYVKALRSYTEAIQLCKGRDQTLFSNRAYGFTKLEQYARAIMDADAAINLAPRWAKGYYRRAEAFRLSGLPVQALQAYRVARHLDPTDGHLSACCADASASIRGMQRTGHTLVGAGLLIGLAIAVLLVATELAAKGFSSLASLGLVALSLGVLGALGGLAARELWRFRLSSRAAAPSLPNDAFVWQQFPDMARSKRHAEASAASDDGQGEGRQRKARSTNKSFRNRTAAPPAGRPPRASRAE